MLQNTNILEGHWYPTTSLHGVKTQKTLTCENLKFLYLYRQ